MTILLKFSRTRELKSRSDVMSQVDIIGIRKLRFLCQKLRIPPDFVNQGFPKRRVCEGFMRRIVVNLLDMLSICS